MICKISKENNEKWIGWKGEAVFDEEFENQKRGRNFAYKPIFVKEEPKIGDITNSGNYRCHGSQSNWENSQVKGLKNFRSEL